MASLIRELDNDALLVMYDAGELPPEDRAELEQMLAVDAGLASGLVAVRADAAAAAAALALYDRADPATGASPSAESVALRRLARAVRQWQVERLARTRPALQPERQPQFPAWAYPVAAAAAVVLGATAWWGWQAGGPGHAKPGQVATAHDAGGRAGPHRSESTVADANRPPTYVSVPRLLLLADTIGTGGDSDADRQADGLAKSGDGVSGRSMFVDGAAD